MLGALLGILGVLLLADWHWLTARWAWPLPPLPARVVGAWLCTYAAGLLWFALRERDWRRVRIVVAPGVLCVVMNGVAAIRYRDGFSGGASTAIYVAALVVVGLAISGSALVEERRTSHT